MTRDTHRVHDDQEALSDADIYAALWATAPFPRLPADAPDGLRRLTVEVDDPKRIYGIHKARRRHNFQLLVERCVYYSSVAIPWGSVARMLTLSQIHPSNPVWMSVENMHNYNMLLLPQTCCEWRPGSSIQLHQRSHVGDIHGQPRQPRIGSLSP